MNPMFAKLLRVAFLISLVFEVDVAAAAPSARRRPPRDPHTPGYVTGQGIARRRIPPTDADGNFIIGPTHNPAPEMTVQEGVPQGDDHSTSR